MSRKWVWKWDENGPRMATVNNPIGIQTAMAVVLLALKHWENKKLSSKLPPVHTPIDRNSPAPSLDCLDNHQPLLPPPITPNPPAVSDASGFKSHCLRFLSIHKQPKKKELVYTACQWYQWLLLRCNVTRALNLATPIGCQCQWQTSRCNRVRLNAS